MYALLLAACAKNSSESTSKPSPCDEPCEETGETSPRPSDGYTLTIEGGFGGGSYPEGTSVHVWADVDPQREIVTSFGPNGAALDSAEWNSGLSMPASDLSLEVSVEEVSVSFTERTLSLPGGPRTLLVAAPNVEMVGAVVFFHGASYSTAELRDNAAMTTVMTLVRAGWLVAALPSEAEVASGTGGFDSRLDLEGNVDLQNAAEAVTLLRQDGTIPEGMPVAAWGMSSGGYFAHTVGAAGIAEIVVAHCAPGNADALAQTEAATAWLLAESDTVVPSAVDLASSFLGELTTRGIPAELYVHPQTPLYDERFTRITGIDLAKSIEIADALRAQGAVDERGAWQVAGSMASVDVPGIDGDLLTAVQAEIEIMAADHELYDDAAQRMLSFLQSNRDGGR